jgi:hypothetical protein
MHRDRPIGLSSESKGKTLTGMNDKSHNNYDVGTDNVALDPKRAYPLNGGGSREHHSVYSHTPMGIPLRVKKP